MEDGYAEIQRPRYPGFEVESATSGRRVDAKAATLLDADLDGSGEVAAIEWDAGGPPLIAEEATHLGLVVLNLDGTHLLIGAGSDSVLAGSVSVHGRVFLVPKAVVIHHARPIWAKTKGQPSKGRFRYLRFDAVEGHEVAFTKRVGGGWTVKIITGTDTTPSMLVTADGDLVEFRQS